MKRIAVFNHKGGVSKTTTSYNLGWSLASLGKRILLVDADAQCNLTQYALGQDEFEKYYESGSQENIHDALAPAFKSQPRLLTPVNCIEIKERLFLCPGHIDFSENEMQLGVAMQLSNSLGSMQNLPGAINYLIDITCKKYSIDYTIFDLNPSLSAINEDILLSSDFFIIPTAPDVFSAMAIKSLSRVLPSWEAWAKSARDSFSEATYKISNTTPRFLGYTINDFNLSGGHPQASFAGFMSKISSVITTTFIEDLKKNNMTLSEDAYERAYRNMVQKANHIEDYYDHYCLAQFSNFNKLIALSHEKSLPIFELKLDHAHEGQAKTLSWFKLLFRIFAERVVELIENE